MKRMIPEETVTALLIVAMVALVTVQVLSRYLLHISLSHTEEVVRYLFVWATFIGAAGAVRRNRHIAATAGFGSPDGRFRKWTGTAVWFTALLFSALMFFRGVGVVILQAGTGQKTAALGMPMWIIGLAVPVGAALLLVRIINRAGKDGREP